VRRSVPAADDEVQRDSKVHGPCRRRDRQPEKGPAPPEGDPASRVLGSRRRVGPQHTRAAGDHREATAKWRPRSRPAPGGWASRQGRDVVGAPPTPTSAKLRGGAKRAIDAGGAEATSTRYSPGRPSLPGLWRGAGSSGPVGAEILLDAVAVPMWAAPTEARTVCSEAKRGWAGRSRTSVATTSPLGGSVFVTVTSSGAGELEGRSASF